MARALLKAREGDTVMLRTPGGDRGARGRRRCATWRSTPDDERQPTDGNRGEPESSEPHAARTISASMGSFRRRLDAPWAAARAGHPNSDARHRAHLTARTWPPIVNDMDQELAGLEQRVAYAHRAYPRRCAPRTSRFGASLPLRTTGNARWPRACAGDHPARFLARTHSRRMMAADAGERGVTLDVTILGREFKVACKEDERAELIGGRDAARPAHARDSRRRQGQPTPIASPSWRPSTSRTNCCASAAPRGAMQPAPIGSD